MLKQIDKPFWLAIGAIVATLSVQIGLSFKAPPQQPANKNSGAIGANQEVSDEATNERIADYTFGLEIFTGVLALVSFGTLILLVRGDKTASKAAEAAKKSADALPTIERAYLYPIIVEAGDILKCVRAAKVFYLDAGNEDRPCTETTKLIWYIQNAGKTPAIIKEIFAGFGLYPVGALIGVVRQTSVLGSNGRTEDLSVEMWRGLTRNEANDVLIYTRHIVFEGQIKFEDIWGVNYVTEFGFAWEQSTQKMQLDHLRTKRAES